MEPRKITETLLTATRRYLAEYAASSLSSQLAAWPETERAQSLEPTALPVLSWLPETVRSAPAPCAALAEALERAAPALVWRQSYALAEVDEAFLANYGWTELVGSRGAIASDSLACGFLLLGPHTLYPSHHHPAEEFYLPLSGEGLWQQGDGPWLSRSPGTLLHHRSGETHAMRSREAPLLALYLWHGRGLSVSARLTGSAGVS